MPRDNWKPTPHKDSITGKQPDSYFTIGGNAGPDGYSRNGSGIDAKLTKEANRRKNGANGR